MQAQLSSNYRENFYLCGNVLVYQACKIMYWQHEYSCLMLSLGLTSLLLFAMQVICGRLLGITSC